MNKPLISILIVNWNGEKIISDCLNSLRKQNYKNIEIIINDNNSSDNSIEVIKKYKEVKLIKSKDNYGFAGGNNIAVKKAKGKYVLLLNTDTEVTKDFLENLVVIMEEDTTLGVVQPKFLYDNEDSPHKNIINSVGAYLTNTGFLYYPGYGKKDTRTLYNKRREVFSAYGACMLIRKEIIDMIGLFDDDYFLYFEETDFCMRVWLAGWRIEYIPGIIIYHKGGVSTRRQGMERIHFHSFKNRICTYIKNLELKTILWMIPYHLFVCEVTSLLYLFTGKPKFFLAIQKAFLWNLTQFNKTIKKRKIIQNKIRKVSDEDYFARVKRNPRPSYYLYLFKGLQYYKD
jgi:GT2 family glycosyltransferase